VRHEQPAPIEDVGQLGSVDLLVGEQAAADTAAVSADQGIAPSMLKHVLGERPQWHSDPCCSARDRFTHRLDGVKFTLNVPLRNTRLDSPVQQL
jgi:hypothetical protein